LLAAAAAEQVLSVGVRLGLLAAQVVLGQLILYLGLL
jgi:hypothetical protein